MEYLAFIIMILASLALLAGIIWAGLAIWRKITSRLEEKDSVPSPDPASGPELPRLNRLTPGWNLMLRLGIISGLTLLMLVPLSMIQNLNEDRSYARKSVIQSLTREWGGSQVIAGPLLAVPATFTWLEAKSLALTERTRLDRVPVRPDSPDSSARPGRNPDLRNESQKPASSLERPLVQTVYEKRTMTRYLIISPEELTAGGDILTEERKRGLYKALVYQTSLKLSGRFVLPKMETAAKLDGSRELTFIDWSKARLITGVSDPAAIKLVKNLTAAGQTPSVSPGSGLGPNIQAAFSAGLDLSDQPAEIDFSLDLSLNGSSSLSIAPMAASTAISLSSSWPHPSFAGQSLPFKREVNENGFQAEWQISSLAHGQPPLLLTDSFSLSEEADFAAGVNLLDPVDSYVKLSRAVKFGSLFIALTFLVLVFSDARCRPAAGGDGSEIPSRPLHPLQYGVAGLALSLFYLIVLSLSEHLSFNTAYLIGSAVILAMFGIYTAIASGSLRRGVLAGFLTGVLYGILYLALSSEDYALLSGTALLTAAVGALMVLTAGINRRHPAAWTAAPDPAKSF